MTEAVPRRGPLARKDRAEKIALFRYQLIRDAADPALSTRQRGPLVRALAAAEHTGPHGQMVRYSRESLDRWIRAWQREGFDGLKPRERTAAPITPASVLALAGTLKLERPHRTAAQVRRIMIETLGDAPSESTLLRHFRTLDIPTGTPAAATGRFEAGHPNEIWVGDALHGPRIAGRKTYLFAFIDDHSRMVTAARWAYAEDSVRLAAALRPALQTHGIPTHCYVDNGAAFVDSALLRTCAKLGMKLIHSKPYRPQGRGKIERFFGSVRSQFLSEITVLDAPVQLTVPGTGRAAGEAGTEESGTAIASLAELNALFTSWVQITYHRTVHSGTGQSPLARWDAGWENRTPVRRSPEVIAEAFRWSVTRRVSKTATVSLQGNTYQVDPLLAGTHVELVYDPFDLTAPITVAGPGGLPAPEAVLLQVRRHVHPKAAAARSDADTAAANVSSGIDYLRVIETRHKTEMTGAPISFDKATTAVDATLGGPA
ncbi:DDE-type integrase/transposase/recombinase [Arthrobacter sp. JSM 101049]|uniref:DDE-type integrase/transposase/recombinase n=1 Tax=Arthrobacter sp. JSM 101049 TaxID=929097 RepID=UPI0035642F87